MELVVILVKAEKGNELIIWEDVVIEDYGCFLDPFTKEEIYTDNFTYRVRTPDHHDLEEMYYPKEVYFPMNELALLSKTTE